MEDNNNNNSNCSWSPSCKGTIGTTSADARGVEVSVLPKVALVSLRRRHQNYKVALKVKAPTAVSLLNRCHHVLIDLVTVLDVSRDMAGAKIQMLKWVMCQLISSLGPTVPTISPWSPSRSLPPNAFFLSAECHGLASTKPT